EINPASAAGAAFDLDVRMFGAQLGKNGIKVANEINVDILLPVGSDGRPTRFRPVAVVVPFQKRNIVIREQLVKRMEDVSAHVGPGEVQDELISFLGARTTREVQNPVRMFAV